MISIFRFLVLLILTFDLAFALDCNLNGKLDSEDISSKVSQDCNSNSIPDECDTSISGFAFGEIKKIPIKQLNLFGFNQSGVYVPNKVADFNGDGKPDLWGRNSLEVYGGYNYIFIYLNNGDNTFKDPVEFYYAGTIGFVAVSVKDEFTQDVDADGDLDIVLRKDTNYWRGNQSRSFEILVLLNDGAGNFTQQSTNIHSIVPAGEYLSNLPSKLIPANLASQTSKDLMMIHEGRIYALYSTGNLTYLPFDMGPSGTADRLSFIPLPFNYSNTYVHGAKGLEAIVAGAGDGSLVTLGDRSPGVGFTDLVSGSLGSSVGRELYHLIPGKLSTSSSTGSSVIAVSSGIDYKFFPTQVGSVEKLGSLVDFNNDGYMDLPVFGAKNGEILLGDENEDLSSKMRIFNPDGLARPILVHDFNGDGKYDILFESDTEGEIAIAFNNSTYPLVSPFSSDVDGNSVPDSCQRATPGDYDGDRKGDRVVVRNYSGNLLWLKRHSSAGLYSASVNVPLGQQGDILLAGDYDGDGKVDPGVVRNSGNSLVWSTVSSNNIPSAIEFGLVGDIPLTGYFDADKRLDRVVVRNYLGNLQWFINTDGQNNSVQSAHLFGLTGDTPYTGDIDGDGLSDLVVARVLSSGQIVWYALSLNSSQVSGPYPWGLRGDYLMPPADIDGDGSDNYLVARSLGGYLNTFSSSPNVPALSEYFDGQKLFGLPGDDLHLVYNLRLPYPQLAVRRPFEGAFTSSFYDLVSEAAVYDSYGFPSDALIGIDGKAVQKYLNVGSLKCEKVLASYERSGYLWNPNPRGRPKYYVPEAGKSQVSSISILSEQGIVLDNMKARSRNSREYSARNRNISNLKKQTSGSVYVQTQFKDGSVVCDKIDFPEMQY